MNHRPLHSGWILSSERTGEIPASVPGCVHTDLLAAGAIGDPYLDDNEHRLAWIGRTDWTYRTSFTWEPDGHEHTDLVCEGLDTVAAVTLNGVLIGETANQHRSYRFPVRHLLREGANELVVRFASAYAYAEARRAELGERPGAYDEPYPFIRKMACNFGWDWGPTLVTAGIWRPIGLESWSGARLAEVRPLARADGHVRVHVRLDRPSEEPIVVTVGGVTAERRLDGQAGVVELRVPDPELWWPRGHGEQPLYDLAVRLGEQEWRGRIGFRDVELDRDAFRIIINGVPVFVRGVNWIPDDCFPSRVTRERLAERFAQATAAGVNLLRVWGGGLYESEDFYSLADELGLLVWQDFPFACAAYPEEEPLRSEVEAEARQHVARLAAHPSLVLWCGNNENLEGHADWGWQDKLAGRSWGAGYYHDLLPSIVAELDPTRPYWPGSPYSGAPDLPPNDPARGTIHIWDVWNREDYLRYAAYRPRFVAEFGFQGPPAYATLRRASSDDPLTPGSSHQKAVDGQDKLLRGLGDHLPRPETFDDWHYLTQLNQARAMAFGIERFRALMPHCMGTIVWQLNDCWPVTSWSAVDGDGRRKPLWYALRRAYADRLITIQDGEAALVNDTGEPWTGELRLERRGLDGRPLAKEVVAVHAAPRSVLRVALPPSVATPDDPARELLTARLDGAATVRGYAEDTAVAYPPAACDAHAERVPGGYRVTVTAASVLRELALFPDRLDPDASVDDQLVTLLPGESAVFEVRTARELDPAALTRFPVLRCLNEEVRT
ncbi:Beta-mannosidase [[Actinomadura] parvosata subsp. kistnae]|uniref:beta-mannosidase n=1 Tax=[Actinomadura] parvosata subsp. kistnae TaxID=1909395 RepID=A0A1U9ZQQ2_9ACTN|nr:glycoside hydrolase family 2 TIM barrel-domain containing protein [Nonomuraea sp. ATCC 55076]AQZ60258.1 beta-mannosidase [Nonomuraea sp. ATCC 55076]SPL91252.1 Beta-mannosidase [Actinomadura parvosata subsp. kistnae]